MRALEEITKRNDAVVIAAYRRALNDGAFVKAQCIRDANPDLFRA